MENNIDKRPEEARQGERGPSMLLVLGLGLAGIVAAYFALAWVNSDDDTVSLEVVEDKDTSRVPAPADQPAEPSAATPPTNEQTNRELAVPGAN